MQKINEVAVGADSHKERIRQKRKQEESRRVHSSDDEQSQCDAKEIAEEQVIHWEGREHKRGSISLLRMSFSKLAEKQKITKGLKWMIKAITASPAKHSSEPSFCAASESTLE